MAAARQSGTAARNEARFRRMALVAPAGIPPPEGDILDMYVGPSERYHRCATSTGNS